MEHLNQFVICLAANNNALTWHKCLPAKPKYFCSTNQPQVLTSTVASSWQILYQPNEREESLW